MFLYVFYRYGVIIMRKNQYCFNTVWALLTSAFILVASPLTFGAIVQSKPQLEATPDPYFSIDETTIQKIKDNPKTPDTIAWDTTAPPTINPPLQPTYSHTESSGFNPKGPLTTGQTPNQRIPDQQLATPAPKLRNRTPRNSIIREQTQLNAPVRMPISGGNNAFQAMKPKNSFSKNEVQEKPPHSLPHRFEGRLTGGTSEIETNSVSFEPGQVLALVGGDPIFVGDLLFETNQMIEQFMPQASASIKEQERKKLIPKMLPKYVEAKVLYVGVVQSLPEGADLKQVLTQAEQQFDKSALPEMLKSSGLKSQNELDANLRAMGSSLRQHRKSWAEEQITKFFLGQQLRRNNEITHQEMLKVYRDNIKDYEKPAKCVWEQIVIRFDRSASRAAAEKSIVALGNDLVFGANFSAVAKASSHGFKASSGGRYDWTTKDSLASKKINDYIFSAPIGELSDIIETQNGFHIARVIERTEATRTPFLEAQTEIKKQIKSTRGSEAYRKHLGDMKKQIPIEYFLNDDQNSNLLKN